MLGSRQVRAEPQDEEEDEEEDEDEEEEEEVLEQEPAAEAPEVGSSFVWSESKGAAHA